MRREDKFKNEQKNRPNPERQLEKKTKEEIRKDNIKKNITIIINNVFPKAKDIHIIGNDVSFSVVNCDVSFDNLSELSKVLGTTNINIGCDEKTSDGCGSCGWGATYERPIYCHSIDLSKFEE